MLKIYPDYYKKFKCIGSSCAHNCCIGWEIDIDEDTKDVYRSVDGEMGKRLRRGIAWDDEPAHFIHRKGNRCPFLNESNLCDIITGLGEDHLCTICAEHPRFKCELPGRIEIGVGLCCEEACRLVLGCRECVTFIRAGDDEGVLDEIISLRDSVIDCLQNREAAIEQRADEILRLCDTSLPERTVTEWAGFLLSLERLDEKWTEMLTLVRDSFDTADTEGFDCHMKDRQHEYEQLLVYFVYRHMACGADIFDAACRAAFAPLAYKVLYAAGACMWTKNGKFSFEDQAELARLFSSEIEYSEENLDIIFDELY